MSILRRIGGADGKEIDRTLGLLFPKFKKEVEKAEDKVLGLIPNKLLPRALRNPEGELKYKERLEVDDNIYPIINYAIFKKYRTSSQYMKHLKGGVIKRIGDDDGILDPMSELGDKIDKLLDPFLKKLIIKLPPDASKALRNANNIIEDPVKGTLNAIGEYKDEIAKAADWTLKKFGYDGGVQQLAGTASKEIAAHESTDAIAKAIEPEGKYYKGKGEEGQAGSQDWKNIPGFITYNGYHTVKGLEMWTSNLWDIEMESFKYGGYGPPDPPYTGGGNNFIPVTSFEFNDTNLSPMAIELFGGSSILIPEQENFQKSIRINVLDSLQDIGGGRRERVWKKYCMDYKKYMVSDFKVMPYKNCCTKITLHMFDTSMRRIHRKSYLGILMTPDTSFSGSSFGHEEYTLEFAIVGEQNLSSSRYFWDS